MLYEEHTKHESEVERLKTKISNLKEQKKLLTIIIAKKNYRLIQLLKRNKFLKGKLTNLG